MAPQQKSTPSITGTRIAVVGSRNFSNADIVTAFVRSLTSTSVVISGGARGADTWAEDAAKQNSLQTEICHVDWVRLGRRAGPIRNAEIVAATDQVVAFWNGKNRGTLNTILSARAAGLPILIFDTEGEKVDIARAIAVAKRNGAAASREKASKEKA